MITLTIVEQGSKSSSKWETQVNDDVVINDLIEHILDNMPLSKKILGIARGCQIIRQKSNLGSTEEIKRNIKRK